MSPVDPATAPAGDAEARIGILVEVISRVLGSPEPVRHAALFQSIAKATGRTEEYVGQDINAAICVCVFSGLFLSESRVGDEFHVSDRTTLRPSRWATRFVWRDKYFNLDPDAEPPDRTA